MNEIIERFKHDDWITYWSGDKWSPLGTSHWVSLYVQRPFTDDTDYFVNQAVVVCDGETTSCYIRESERKLFGAGIVEKVNSNPSYVSEVCMGLKSGADMILSIYKDIRTDFTYEFYANYKTVFIKDYYPFHIKVKNVVDFLPKDLLEKYLPELQEARVHAEPVFSLEIGFMKRIADFVARKSGYKAEHVLYCLTDEVASYWKDGKNLPDIKTLEERLNGVAMFFKDEKIAGVLSGAEITGLSSIFSVAKDANKLQGQMAFKGKVTGRVRIIFDPSAVKQFEKGDILVAPWTRPEYLPIMEKAGAFITDGGGILSHAAIVARELKKPCVIGTKVATKVLKDGDMVEVDAERGVVKIIKRASV